MSARSYQLTAKLVAIHGGHAAVLCLDESAIGRSYQLHGSRPCLNERVTRLGLRAELANQPAAAIDPIEDKTAVTIVTIRGPLEQRSQRRDSGCGGGWTDGYDAITERMQDALAAGDVVMVIDSPGGAVAGLQEAVKQIAQAKADHGRHVVAYANESIGSAAYWLAAAIADDIYLPDNGCVGSIGARGTHQSVAGMLKKAGVEVTHIVWPGEGKTAFDPSKPLSDEARERGQRDIDAIGEEFAAAVIAARPGVTLKQIIALDADSPRGLDAVKAGLADGVASLDEVVAMAITHAEEKTMAEEEKPKDDDETARAEDEPSDEEECEECGGEGCEKCEGEDEEEEDDE
jgi:ClpP class serine protease